MRKSLMLLVAAALMLVPVALSAQTSASTTINVNATVQRGITISAAAASLNFGAFVTQSGVTPSIDANTNVANGIGAGSAVRFDVTGASSRNIIFSWGTATLSNGTDNLTFTPKVVGDQSLANQATAGEILSGAGGALTNADPGLYHVWVGGTLTAIGAISVGTYTTAAPWTLTVQYN